MSRTNGCPFLVCLLFLDALLCLFPSYKFSLIKRKKESVKPLSLPTFKEGTTAIQGNVISTYNPNLTKQKKTINSTVYAMNPFYLFLQGIVNVGNFGLKYAVSYSKT